MMVFLFIMSGRIGDNYKLSNGKFVNVPKVESIVKEYIKGMVVVFGENKEYNEIITDEKVSPEIINEINKKLESYLKIKKTHYLPTEEWANYLTPKMSIKRKSW